MQDYDQRTVTVPREIFSKLSGADSGRLKTCSQVLGKETAGKHRSHAAASQQQYWSIKQKYRDVLLFFKVGKFPELFRMVPRCPSLLNRVLKPLCGKANFTSSTKTMPRCPSLLRIILRLAVQNARVVRPSAHKFTTLLSGQALLYCSGAPELVHT